MNEKLKGVQTKIVEVWNKYDKKRKIQMISVVAVVIIMLIILAVVVSRPTYATLIECTDTATAASITETLTANSINFDTQNNGLIILVEEKDLVNATYLIAQNGYTAKGYSIDDYVNNVGIGTTASDRERLYQKYLEDKMVQTMESFDYVKSAEVTFTMPSTNYSVLENEEDTYVGVKLTLSKNMPEGAANSMARYIATAVGNKTTARVTIVDSSGNSLFMSDEIDGEESGTISADKAETIRNEFRNIVITNITKLFTATGYSSVTVSPNIDVDFSVINTVDTKYYNPDALKKGDYIYEQEGSSGVSGIPGTDSNDDDTGYYIDTGDGTITSVNIQKNDYENSNTITSTTTGQRGVVQYGSSSVAVVLNRYRVYDEETADTGDLSWAEFKEANGEILPIENLDTQMIIQAISAASGIPQANISVMAYTVPMFNDYVSETEFVKDILPIIIAVIILALLAFIVWRSLRPVKVTEVETELSVDELLAATRENQKPVEEIDMEEKSEVRKAIDKFVDENPEAVAILMRNWLSDDWD